MPLPGPTHIPPIGEQTDPDKVRVAAVIGGQLASAPARGFGLTPQELGNLQALTAGYSVTAETRSRVVNGAMQVSQENGNTVGSASYYPCDQWILITSTTGTIQTQRVQVTTPKGSRDRLRVAVAVADTSMTTTEQISVSQAIEGGRMADFGYGTASARQSILRFGFKGPAGTYSVSIRNSADNRSFIAMFTVAAGQANTDTEQVIVVPGDTTGTWLNDTSLGMRICFMFAFGPTYTGVAGWQAGTFMGTSAMTNNVAVGSSIFELFDVGLYLDPDATGLPPKWVMPDEAEEMQACQRYWCRQYCYAMCTQAGTYGITPVYFPQRMRSTPAVTNANPGTHSNLPTVVGDFVTGPEAGYFQISAGSTNANVINRLNNYSARM